ncbi:ImmA/IrrE family metallo-endopeptidase [Mesorhizobium sp. M1273]|uniref:ImmA/IrrE family metallo-endopeptidase n=1 Tax=Mesorhizobium sp. M1273 TaxID=2957075 RepID=UPI0033369158
MDEFTAVMKARELVRKAGILSAPVDTKAYLPHVHAKLKVDKTMGDGEAGSTFEISGTYYISINGNERPERQRFTTCHEIAHIVLALPSEHVHGTWWSYAKRSPNEILCDTFAAELLLPHKLFKPLVDDTQFGFKAIGGLAKDFETSLTATASRFATLSDAPCAFVLSEGGCVRYAVMSPALREVKAYVAREPLPDNCQAEALRRGNPYEGPAEIPADLWFQDWRRGGTLVEDTRYSSEWDQTLTLLWFEDEEVPEVKRDHEDRASDDEGLAELDGILPWPGRKRRR